MNREVEKIIAEAVRLKAQNVLLWAQCCHIFLLGLYSLPYAIPLMLFIAEAVRLKAQNVLLWAQCCHIFLLGLYSLPYAIPLMLFIDWMYSK